MRRVLPWSILLLAMTCGAVTPSNAAASGPDQAPSGAAAPKTPTFTPDDLRTPAAPGFLLLDVTPVAIERPTTPRAFAVSLLSAVAQSDNLLPTDFAVELAPYWMTSRRELDYATYANPGVLQSIAQTLSFSLAASKASAKQAGAADATDLGFGLRVSLLAGKAAASTMEVTARQYEYLLLDLLLSEAREGVPLTSGVLASIDRIASDPDRFLAFDPTDSETERARKRKVFVQRLQSIREAVEEGLREHDPTVQILSGLMAASEEALQKAALAVQRANRRRVGWLLDLGAAGAYRIGNASVGTHEWNSSGLWVTPGYRAPNGRTEFLAAFRAINRKAPIDGTAYDVGARIVQQFADLGVSFEVLRRWGEAVKGREGRGRFDAAFDYKLTDGCFLTASFGKNFNDTADASSDGGLLAVLGLSLGFGEKPTVRVR